MSDHGGLIAISPYEIGRHWWLHEIRVKRAILRVHGIHSVPSIKKHQKELCALRREHYGEKRTEKPVAKKAKG